MPDETKKPDVREYLEVEEQFDAKMAEIERAGAFDVSHGVETSTPFESWDVDEIDEAGLLNNFRYSPSPAGTLRTVIASVPVAFEDVTFVDFGCGKGRVLLVASEFPFKRIVGVEYSQQLCAIGRQNVAGYSSASQQCRDIEIVHRDATAFEIPDDAGVFYFYEPFSAAVTETVLENIERSLARAPRTAIVCLVGRALLPVVEGRAPWVPYGSVMKSPDDDYFDARLFAAGGDHVPSA